MARKRSDPKAPTLPGTAKRETVGTVERAAAADLRTLRELDMTGTGIEALAAAYRRAARELDRAERARKPWDAFAAMRELRSTRLELGPTVSPIDADELDQIMSEITGLLRGDDPTR